MGRRGEKTALKGRQPADATPTTDNKDRVGYGGFVFWGTMAMGEIIAMGATMAMLSGSHRESERNTTRSVGVTASPRGVTYSLVAAAACDGTEVKRGLSRDGWLPADRVVGAVVDQHVLEVCASVLRHAGHGAKVHEGRPIAVKGEHAAVGPGVGDAQGDGGGVAHGTDSEKVLFYSAWGENAGSGGEPITPTSRVSS